MKRLNIQIFLQVLSSGHTERFWTNHLTQITYERGTLLDFSPSQTRKIQECGYTQTVLEGRKKSHWNKQNKKANRRWAKQRQLK